jgi:serine/threonine protein kinase
MVGAQLNDNLESEEMHTAVGTMQFMAPEIMKGDEKYGRKVSPSHLLTGLISWPGVHVVYRVRLCAVELPPPPPFSNHMALECVTHPPGFIHPRVSPLSPIFHPQADIWSVGMAVLEMATGKPAWPNPAVATFKICATEEMPPIPDFLSADAHNFLELVGVHSPRLRAGSLWFPHGSPQAMGVFLGVMVVCGSFGWID